MILPKPQDALHKAQLYRLLTEILDQPFLSEHLSFKGGTCAAMLGFLDRFSIDLDFDLQQKQLNEKAHLELLPIFDHLALKLDSKSSRSLFYLLIYDAPVGQRNSMKLSIMTDCPQANVHKPYYLPDIDRYAICQTKETMFANKLVALTDRYMKHESIAGRDVYDIHHFFLQGYTYEQVVIEERTGKKTADYLIDLVKFIEKNITDTILSQDLNTLLAREKYNRIRKTLKQETTMFLKAEITRLHAIPGKTHA